MNLCAVMMDRDSRNNCSVLNTQYNFSPGALFHRLFSSLTQVFFRPELISRFCSRYKIKKNLASSKGLPSFSVFPQTNILFFLTGFLAEIWVGFVLVSSFRTLLDLNDPSPIVAQIFIFPIFPQKCLDLKIHHPQVRNSLFQYFSSQCTLPVTLLNFGNELVPPICRHLGLPKFAPRPNGNTLAWQPLPLSGLSPTNTEKLVIFEYPH